MSGKFVKGARVRLRGRHVSGVAPKAFPLSGSTGTLLDDATAEGHCSVRLDGEATPGRPTVSVCAHVGWLDVLGPNGLPADVGDRDADAAAGYHDADAPVVVDAGDRLVDRLVGGRVGSRVRVRAAGYTDGLTGTVVGVRPGVGYDRVLIAFDLAGRPATLDIAADAVEDAE